MRSVMLDPRHIREQVGLEPGTQSVLDIDTHIPISVWLDLAGPGSQDAGVAAPAGPGADAPVLVFLGDFRIGQLGAAGSQLYRPAIEEAREARLIVAVTALRDRAEDGSWRLHVPWPR